MDKNKDKSRLEYDQRVILFVGSLLIILLVYLFFKYVFSYIAPFAIGFLIALIMEKPVEKLAVAMGRISYKLFHTKPSLSKRRTAASAVIMILITAAVLAVLVYVTYMGLSEIRRFIANYSYYSEAVSHKLAGFAAGVEGSLNLEPGVITSFIEGLPGEIGKMNLTEKLMPLVAILGKKMIMALGAAIISLMSVVYLAANVGRIRVWRKTTVFREEVALLHRGLSRLINVYFRIQLMIFAINAGVCVVSLFITGNEYAVILGILIGLLDALPVFGTGTVLIPWALILILSGSYFKGAVLIVAYIITYLIREIMESKCTGDKMGISSLVMLMVIFVGFLVYGIWGFILGPVSYCIIKPLVEYLDRWLKSRFYRGKL